MHDRLFLKLQVANNDARQQQHHTAQWIPNYTLTSFENVEKEQDLQWLLATPNRVKKIVF